MTHPPRPLYKITRKPCFVDLTNEKVGTYVCISPTGEADVNGSLLWLLRCSCNATKVMSVSNVRRYQRSGCRPFCTCADYKACPRGHRIAKVKRDEENRKDAMCQCCRQSWRVVGGRCSCGMVYAPEPAIELVTDSRTSSAGRALDFGISGLNGFRKSRAKVRAA